MKTSLIVFFLLSPLVFCDQYENVYDAGDGLAVMEVGYFLTGILVPWIMGLTFCIVSCVFCCIPKKYQLPKQAFVAVPPQPMIYAPYQPYQNQGYNNGMIQPGYAVQPGYGVQPGYAVQPGSMPVGYENQMGYANYGNPMQGGYTGGVQEGQNFNYNQQPPNVLPQELADGSNVK